MNEIGEKIVAEARTWIDTEWQHQASLKGVAVDCVGLVRAVYTAVTGNSVTTELDYHRMPIPGRENRIIQEMTRYATPISLDDLRPGDILIFRFMDGVSNHVGIYSSNGQFIHAWQDVNRVVEMPYTAEWRRITKACLRVVG